MCHIANLFPIGGVAIDRFVTYIFCVYVTTLLVLLATIIIMIIVTTSISSSSAAINIAFIVVNKTALIAHVLYIIFRLYFIALN